MVHITEALANKHAPEASSESGIHTSGLQQATRLHEKNNVVYQAPLTVTPSATGSVDTTASARDATLEMDDSDLASMETNETNTEILFDRYQRLMAPHMPFVVVPTGTDVSRLANNKPFLLQAIKAVAFFHDTAVQQILVKDLVREISDRVLINGEKSLDLLQGMLVIGNWYNPHLFAPPSHTVLLHLTMALTHDLEIDRAPGFCEKAALMEASQAHGVPQPAKVVTNDERRAVLGTFYLTSQIFTSFRKIDNLNWTPWHTACVEVLTQAREYESDLLLVQLAQGQRIMQEAMATDCEHAPVQLYAKSFLSDLDRAALASGNAATAIVSRLQQACTRTAIWERSFGNLATHTVKETDLRQRLDGMWQCMDAAKRYTEIYLELPVEDYLVVPFGVFAQFAYIFVVLVRASLIEMDGWDVQALREFVDFSTLLGEASRRYDAVSQTHPDGLNLNNEAFAKWSAKIKWAKSFYDTKFLCLASNAPTANQPPFEVRATDANETHVPYSASLAPLEALEEPTSNPFAAFDDWGSFADPSAFLEDMDFGVSNV
ncbi:uncharacterized protein J4E92_001120 [Alternaria infectoria]|uniref:uncharacterized protein n=1 Tax=Alternaria infectoria TaxID=45303 RepID=UPI00221FC7EB|nr:uncharacterized protein J4E92_001120 [Alternaria infectoria]KAI4939834.1 hypothetical protein J4E92_001120 [Alternaria infectoria]